MNVSFFDDLLSSFPRGRGLIGLGCGEKAGRPSVADLLKPSVAHGALGRRGGG
jgi:hypothetical protein